MARQTLGSERTGKIWLRLSAIVLSTACVQSPLATSERTPSVVSDALSESEPTAVDQDVAPGDRVIDPGGPMFSGAGFWASSSWWESASTPGPFGPGYFVAPTIESSDPAEYWWQEPDGGCRSIAAWWTAEGNRSSRATYVAVDGEGRELARRVVAQTVDGGGWQPLFNADFPAGEAVVLLSRWDMPGHFVVADALRIRSCDGSEPERESDPDPVVEPWLDFASPAAGASVDNPVTFALTGEAIDSIRLSSEGWEMVRWDVDTDGWQVSYTFSSTDRPRTVLAEGFAEDGTLVATVERTITPIGPATGVESVPYFYQYDNAYEPSATCGLTSTAMVLEYWGGRGRTPDELYLRYGKAQGQSPSGIAALLSWEGLETRWSTQGTRADLRDWLDSGRPVIVHGYWTGAGHIAVLVGYDESDWIVHDPAGDWYTCYGCGEGESVRYPRGGAWDDRLSWDGDIWYSVADTRPF